MKKLFSYIFLSLLVCNVGFTLSLKDFLPFKKNKLPLELFGIKLFENVNEYSKVKIVSFHNLDKTWAETEYFKNEIREFNVEEVVIKNSNFERYYIYLNKKLEIVGIEGYADIQGDNNVQVCLKKKTKLLKSIIELHKLNINNFKEKNYVSKDGKENGMSLKSVFKFNYDGIDLLYSLSCESSIFDDTDKWNTSLYIEFFTEKLANEYFKALEFNESEKNVEQLLSDTKGF